jgi:hypothetical protein
VTGGRPGLGDMAVQAALALTQEFFSEPDREGRARVPFTQAHVLISGRLDAWDGWRDLEPVAKALTGRLLRVRHNELASLQRFLDAARRVCAAPDSPFVIPAGVAPHEAGEVLALHGQPPLVFAGQMIEAMEAEHARQRPPVPAAGGGLWEFGWRDRSQVTLPVALQAPVIEPVVIDTAPYVGEFPVTCKELSGIAAELDRAWGGHAWREDVVTSILAGLRDDQDLPIEELFLAAARLNLLNAPTGVGKTVLMRVLGIAAARAGVPITLVARDIDDAHAVRDALDADIGKLTWPPGRRQPQCVLLLSPRRMHEKALSAAELGSWDRVDRLGYACALAGCVTSGPLPEAGAEPCGNLMPAEPDASGDGQRREVAPGRRSCPWRGVCARHSPARNAATADIIVTYHHYLASGQMPVPVRIDGVDADRGSILEVIMRRCPIVVVDEIDQFQSVLVETGSQEVVLAAKGRAAGSLPLAQIEVDRARLAAAADRQILPPLARARFLSEQFLNYILEGELWLDEYDDRPSSGWHLPGSNDRMLIRALLAVPDGIEIPDFAYRTFNALFPDRDDPQPEELDDDLAAVRGLLAESVSNDDGADRITELKHRLSDALSSRVEDRGARARVVNALLVRAWLGSLRQALTRLTYTVTTPEASLPAARQLADKLGVFVQHATIPYGPLGYMLFGFRVQTADGPQRSGQLSTQAIAGDPHTTTAQLGGTVALDCCGLERIVLGMSATAFFPGAAREHIHAPITWTMTDADPGAVTAAEGSVFRDPYTAIRVGGQPEGAKDDILIELGRRLWDQQLGPHIAALSADPRRADRARVLVITNSYRQCSLLAHGIAQATNPARLAVAVSPDPAKRQIIPPPGALLLAPGQFETFPQHPGVDVLLAPISRTARGLNILIPGQQRSAISEIWVCVRPVAQLSEPAEMFASINAHAIERVPPGPDPGAVLAAQRSAAHQRLYRLLGSDPRFSLMARELKAEVVAGILVDFIQLAGRARRGRTDVELYLVDNAFHDSRLGSDLPSLLRYCYDTLTPARQAAMARIYGSTLTSLLTYAGVNPAETKP